MAKSFFLRLNILRLRLIHHLNIYQSNLSQFSSFTAYVLCVVWMERKHAHTHTHTPIHKPQYSRITAGNRIEKESICCMTDEVAYIWLMIQNLRMWEHIRSRIETVREEGSGYGGQKECIIQCHSKRISSKCECVARNLFSDDAC